MRAHRPRDERSGDATRAAACAAFVLCAAVAASGCGTPGEPPGASADPVLAVGSFPVEGASEAAAYVEHAFPAAVLVRLSEAEGIDLVADPAPAGGAKDPTYRLEGSIVESPGTVRVRYALVPTAGGSALLEREIETPSDRLDVVAQEAAEDAVRALGRRRTPAYEHIADLAGGEAMEASPAAARMRAVVRANDIGGSMELSARLVEEFRGDPAAHAFRAWALMLAWDADPANEIVLGQLKERLATLDGIDPDSPYDELILGFVYRSSGEPEPARAMYARVIARTDVTHAVRAWALRQRSYAYVQTGAAGPALADAEEAVRLDPLSASGLAAASRALEALGRHDDAVERSTRALALRPTSWRYQQRLGILLATTGRMTEGLRHLEQACRMAGNQETCANHAVVLQRSGRADEARDVARHAASLASSRFGLYNLACYHTLASEYGAALDALDGAIDLGFADVLIETDPDLQALRGRSGFTEALRAVEDRVRRRRQMSLSAFPWQALAAPPPREVAAA